MRLRTTVTATGLLFALTGCGGSADRSAATAAGDTVIVVPYTVEPGRSRADAVKAIGDIAANMRTQPGHVDARLLEESAPGVQPQFVHVTRWRSFDDWNALSGSPEFQKVLDRNLPAVRVSLAQVYKPVAK